MRIFVIAVHPDDKTWEAGETLFKHKKGTQNFLSA